MKKEVKKFVYSPSQRKTQDISPPEWCMFEIGWDAKHHTYVNGFPYTEMMNEDSNSNWDDSVTMFVGPDYKITRK